MHDRAVAQSTIAVVTALNTAVQRCAEVTQLVNEPQIHGMVLLSLSSSSAASGCIL